MELLINVNAKSLFLLGLDLVRKIGGLIINIKSFSNQEIYVMILLDLTVFGGLLGKVG